MKRIAFCYDFDYTLSTCDMQAFTLIPDLGMDVEAFWQLSNRTAAENGMDNILTWMYLILDFAQRKGITVTREYLRRHGQNIDFFPGVAEWFPLVNEYAAKRGLQAEHYIISSGLKEIVEGTVVAPLVDRIYASSYYYDEHGAARWPAQSVNYTNKTQYLFRIAKGVFDEADASVNRSLDGQPMHVPYERMVYIGDSHTDVPCMQLLRDRGGTSIGVYNPWADLPRHIHDLHRQGRINFSAPSDYRPDGALFGIVRDTIDRLARD